MPRVSAAHRPTLKATLLVAVGAAGTLGASVLYELSRPSPNLQAVAEWNPPTQARTASLAPMASDPMAKADAGGAGRQGAGAKTEVLLLSGQVTSAGEGVAKAQIFAIPTNAAAIQRIESNVGVSPDELLKGMPNAKADDVGRFSLQVHQPGEWVLLAFSETAGPAVAKAVAGSTDVQLQAPKSLGMAGRVVDAKQNAIPKAMVIAIHSRSAVPDPSWPVERKVAYAAFRRYVESDATGAFDLRGLDEALCTLIVSHADYASYKELNVSPAEVAKGDKAEPKTIVLRAAATLSGIVWDHQQKPVANAAVATMGITSDGTPEESDDVTTDAKGVYSAGHVLAGDMALDVKVVANGLATTVVRIPALVPGEHRTQNFVLEPAAPLTVRIVGDGGAPIAGAMVEAYETSNHTYLCTLTTDASGIARFSSASPTRTYRVLAAAAGYALGVLPEVRANDSRDLVLKPVCIVEGIVTAEGKGPVAGAVRLRKESDHDELGETFKSSCGKDGKFRIDGLEEGIYTLSAEAPGFAPTQQKALAVAPGTKTVRLTLPRGEALQGRVVNGKGQGMAGVVVVVPETNGAGTKVRDFHQQSAKTDAMGAFQIAGASSNTKFLVLAKANAVPRVARVLAQTSGGGAADVGELVFEDGGTIAGKVVDRNGMPVADAVCQLLGDDLIGNAAPSVTTGLNGAFQFDGVPAGVYAVDVYDPATYAVTGVTTRVTTEAVVKAGETTHLVVDARRNGRLYGQVRVRGVLPAVEFDVVLRKPGARVALLAETRVTWSGSYDLPIPAPGTYLLEVCSMEGPSIRASRTVTIGPREEKAIDLEIGDASISGTVRSKESGAPIAGAQVRVGTEEGAEWTVVADGSGRYQLDGIPAVNVWVSAISEEHASLSRKRVSFATTRSLVLDLELERRTELVVRAVSPEGPLSGAKVSVWNEKGQLVVERMTNLQGLASWDTLTPARYAIAIEHAKYEGYQAAADLTGGQRTDATPALKPTGTVVALVKGKNGESAAQTQVFVTSSTGLRRWATADAFGVVRFEAVADGTATLQAGSASATVTVRAGETLQTTLEK